jgi:hypothetical protein
MYDINTAIKRTALVYDPRIIWLTDLWIVKSISDCLFYKKHDNIKSERINVNKWIVTIDKQADDGNTKWELWIEEPSFHLLKKTCTAPYGMMYSIENTYADKTIPFPTQTHIYREQNGKVLFDREINVTMFKKIDFFR